VRVRSVQVHDDAVERAEAGQRVAVSLPGVDRDALRRGDALVERGAYPASYRLEVALEELQEVSDGARLHVHHGTAEHYARVVRRGERYAQLRLTSPAVAARGDRVVLRDGTTLGGGVVLDPSPPRLTTAERSARIERGEIAATVHEPVPLEELRRLSSEVPAGVEEAGGWAFSRAWLEDLEAGLRARIADADPLDPGVPPPSASWATAVLPLLGLERRGAKLYLPGARASLGEREAAAAVLEGRLADAGFVPVKVEDSKLAAYLEGEGRLVRLGDGYAVGADAFERARELLLEECERNGRIALARFRDLLGTGRKQAQLLLERFDADGVTRRIGDERVLRRRATRA
jgi:selenocysteine-specific elongation factor